MGMRLIGKAVEEMLLGSFSKTVTRILDGNNQIVGTIHILGTYDTFLSIEHRILDEFLNDISQQMLINIHDEVLIGILNDGLKFRIGITAPSHVTVSIEGSRKVSGLSIDFNHTGIDT